MLFGIGGEWVCVRPCVSDDVSIVFCFFPSLSNGVWVCERCIVYGVTCVSVCGKERRQRSGEVSCSSSSQTQKAIRVPVWSAAAICECWARLFLCGSIGCIELTSNSSFGHGFLVKRDWIWGCGPWPSFSWLKGTSYVGICFRINRKGNGGCRLDPPYCMKSRVYIPRVNRACCCCCGTTASMWVWVRAMVCAVRASVSVCYRVFIGARFLTSLALVSCDANVSVHIFCGACCCCRLPLPFLLLFSLFIFFFFLLSRTSITLYFSLCAHRCVWASVYVRGIFVGVAVSLVLPLSSFLFQKYRVVIFFFVQFSRRNVLRL